MREPDPIPVAQQSRLRGALSRFQAMSAAGPMVLLAATVAALLIANSPWGATFTGFWERELGLTFGGRVLDQSLRHWIDDGLMAIFFLVIGLEIKRELLVGHLSSVRKAALPILAALGGMLVPAAVFLALNLSSGGAGGWAIPCATDIAFALGVASLLGRRVGTGMVVFLGALATVDDIGAMAVIAAFYSSGLHWTWLLAAAALWLLLLAFNRAHVDALWPYLTVGLVFWFAFLSSGLHATVAGVLVALVIPTQARLAPMPFVTWARRTLEGIAAIDVPGQHVLVNDRQQAMAEEIRQAARYTQAPLQRLERALAPVSSLVILPLFALANAGIRFPGSGALQLLVHPVGLGTWLGLALGKPLGIAALTWTAVRTGVASLPEGMRWNHVVGAAWLGGIGFTMSMFISNLAFRDAGLALEARMAVLFGSLVSAVAAYLFFRLFVRQAPG
jgi:Na+:H+ antiporter, NhaA family